MRVVCVFLAVGTLVSSLQADDSRPRLVVVAVFDQFRGDYITRWDSHFGKNGFRRLKDEGAYFSNCQYPYAATFTGAGHATLVAGCSPKVHGIVGNEWRVYSTGTNQICVTSLQSERVPPATLNSTSSKGGVSPELIKVETIGDVLKSSSNGESKVVSLSLKDRSAILLGGQAPDICCWFDTDAGAFVTSSHYTTKLYPWVTRFNREKLANKWFGVDWTPLRPELDYDKIVGPDNARGEGTGVRQGRLFPHDMTGGVGSPAMPYYEAVICSPFGSDLLLGLAQQAIDAEGLGSRDTPDLLCLSFSSNDAVGHSWGPDSHEVFDMTLRSDLIVRDMLKLLDEKIGKNRYLLVVTSDHGICPLPEVARLKKEDAGRIPITNLLRAADAMFERTFGGRGPQRTLWFETIVNRWFYFDRAKLKQMGIKQEKAEEVLAAWLKKQQGIAAVYTRSQVEKGLADDEPFASQVDLSYFADRSGDVQIVLKPNWLLDDNTSGTNHGSPYEYDTHVPLFVFGSGVTPGVHSDRVSPTCVAAILAHGLGAPLPKTAEKVVPKGLFDDVKRAKPQSSGTKRNQ